MKKILTCLICLALAAVMAFGFTACELFGGDKEYIIQYTYEGETFQLTVKKGEPTFSAKFPKKRGTSFWDCLTLSRAERSTFLQAVLR